jgi:hypothetical protein
VRMRRKDSMVSLWNNSGRSVIQLGIKMDYRTGLLNLPMGTLY